MINEKLLKNEELAVYRLRELYSSFGYTQYKMSKFEEYDLYVRNKDFLISDRIITFTDTNGKLLALKPDVTLSIINNFGKSVDGIQKMYYNENVYRVSGGTGKFKEIMQTGLECIGKISLYEITEVLYLAIKSLQLTDSNFSLELSHAGLMNALLSDVGISDKIMDLVLQSVKLKSTGACEEMLKSGKLTEQQFELIKAFTVNYSDIYSFNKAFCEFINSEECKKHFDEFQAIISGVNFDEFKGKLTINFSLSSDAGYYSGIVFKGYIAGIPTSVLSGGQYDTLIKKFINDGGAVGFAVYLDNFERFKLATPEYDVDTILLVDKNDKPQEILKTAEKIKSTGDSVLIQTELPQNIRYRRVVRMEG
ncbi:MAG: ATP phosphoribosyltransferase regulatory subunit [Clostridia bacterium]|nr:ATP phosphoribosyltransferase regulatory subunit [Clostridia bacterium]